MKKTISVLLLSLVYTIMGFQEALIPAWNVWIEIGIALFLLLASMLLNRERLNAKSAISFLLFFAVLLAIKRGFPETVEAVAATGLHFLLFLCVSAVILFLNKDVFLKEGALSLRTLLTFLLIIAVIHMLRMHLLKALLPAAYIPAEITVSLLILAALVFWNKEQLK
ncbi:MAG: hypothetical protein WC210_02865 [Candidatus Neomarinimicrobiota bacterium]